MGENEWVLVSFIIFFAIVFYAGAHKAIAKALDDRAANIKAELDEARRLKTEAQGLLAEYQRKREQADQEAEEIVSQAKREAEAMQREAQDALEASIARRTKAAEEKIRRAEEQAVADVRNTAVDMAVTAARGMMAGSVPGSQTNNTLLDRSIAELPSRLNG